MKEIEILNHNAEVASRLLKTLANPHRLMVLCNLIKGEHTAGELEAEVGLSQSALSQHLTRLKDEGIVDSRREAQKMYYRLIDEDAQAILQTLYDIYCGQKNE